MSNSNSLLLVPRVRCCHPGSSPERLGAARRRGLVGRRDQLRAVGAWMSFAVLAVINHPGRLVIADTRSGVDSTSQKDDAVGRFLLRKLSKMHQIVGTWPLSEPRGRNKLFVGGSGRSREWECPDCRPLCHLVWFSHHRGWSWAMPATLTRASKAETLHHYQTAQMEPTLRRRPIFDSLLQRAPTGSCLASSK